MDMCTIEKLQRQVDEMSLNQEQMMDKLQKIEKNHQKYVTCIEDKISRIRGKRETRREYFMRNFAGNLSAEETKYDSDETKPSEETLNEISNYKREKEIAYKQRPPTIKWFKSCPKDLQTISIDSIQGRKTFAFDEQTNGFKYNVFGRRLNGKEEKLAEAVITEKSKAFFKALFKMIREELTRVGCTFDKITFVVDFDRAMVKAAKKIFHKAKSIQGSTLSYFLVLTEKRLEMAFPNSPAFNRWFNRLLVLPYLPEELVELSGVLKNPSFRYESEDFLNYLKTVWMKKPFRGMLNKFGVIEPKTALIALNYYKNRGESLPIIPGDELERRQQITEIFERFKQTFNSRFVKETDIWLYLDSLVPYILE